MNPRSYLAAAALSLAAVGAVAQDYGYITAEELKPRLSAPDKPILIDIQVPTDYAKRHLPGAIATFAYPAKSEEERDRLKPQVSRILASKQDVVIVCPAGGGGARNTFDYLKSQGVPASRMRILEKGQKGWPYPEVLVKAD